MKLKYQMRGLGIGIMVTALLMGVATGKGIPLSDAEIRAKALELGMVERESLKLTDLQEKSQASMGTDSPEEGAAILDGAGMNGSGEPDIDSGAIGSEEPDASSGANGSDGLDFSSGENGPGKSGIISGTDELDQADSASGTGTSAEPGALPEQDGSENSGSGAQEREGGYSEENGGSSAGDAVTVVIEFGVTSAHVSEILEEAGLVEDASVFDAYLCNNGYSRKITAGVYEIQPGTSEEEIIEIITKKR